MLEDIFLSTVEMSKIREISPVALAFIGDAVHTMFVRDRVIKGDIELLKNYHQKAASLCKAKSQAEVLNALVPYLNADEQDIVRRARNAKLHHVAKNSDIETYKKATSFEALVGYLYLTGNFKRLNQILKNKENE